MELPNRDACDRAFQTRDPLFDGLLFQSPGRAHAAQHLWAHDAGAKK